MIIARLQGGLGNQMFEYAFGRAVALRNSAELALDLSQYEEDLQRRYMLDAFRIEARIATPQEVAAFVGGNRFTRKLLSLLGSPRTIHEPSFAFYPRALEAKDPCYLDGYWQSEKYFADIVPTLRKEFALKESLSEEARKIAAKISEGTSVSIHVRRGDYAGSQFELLGAGYYTRAIAKIQETVPHPKYFIFSDDIAWARENLPIPDPTFVSGRGLSDIEELTLMSRCTHHIIANSSFSWWGAWLDPRSEKIVVAPEKWFVLDVHNTEDIVPESWVRM